MSPLAIKILWIIGWALLGVLLAIVSFGLLRRAADRITPESAGKPGPVVVLITSRLLRFIMIGAALFFAVRMGLVYALSFIGGLTLTRVTQVILYNRRLSAMEQLAAEKDASIGRD